VADPDELRKQLKSHFLLQLIMFTDVCCRELSVFTRRRSFAEYWKHFVARLNDVYPSGYNSAGSERIRMKFGALRVYMYCLQQALADFERDLRRSESGSACRNFVFFLFW